MPNNNNNSNKKSSNTMLYILLGLGLIFVLFLVQMMGFGFGDPKKYRKARKAADGWEEGKSIPSDWTKFCEDDDNKEFVKDIKKFKDSFSGKIAKVVQWDSFDDVPPCN